MIDVNKLRRETPTAARLTHFNNAGASLMPAPVQAAMLGHLALEADIGGYEAAAAAQADIDLFYDHVAGLIGGQREEVSFLDSATRAWLAVFHAMTWREGDVVLTAKSEYNSNMVSFLHARRLYGIEFHLVPDDASGALDVDALERMITPRTRLICLTHMPTNDGLINPAAAVGAVARRHGIPYLLDACQSAGQMPIDVQALGCTMLSATGRKFMRAPRGTGFLWVHRDWLDRLVPQAVDNRSGSWTGPENYELARDGRRFELWENNVAGQIALGAAARYATQCGMDAIWSRIQMLSSYLRQSLADIAGVLVHDQGHEKSGIVTFTCSNMSSGDVVTRLRSEFRINTSLSAVQLTRTKLLEAGITHLVRASVHAFNTTDEIDQLIAALRACGISTNPTTD